MKNKKGFTLIELLAVIVILGIIMTIATTAVIKNINDSKTKAKYIAAKEIVEIASAYMEVEGSGENNCVYIKKMIENEYLEKDTTNPRTGENGFNSVEDNDQKVCKDEEIHEQTDYNPINEVYEFEGYKYHLK